MKKIFFAVLICILVLTAQVFATDISVDDVKIVFTDAEPVVKDGRTLTPLRAVAETMQADVKWNEGDKSVVLSKEVSNVSYGGVTYDKVVFVGEMKLGSFTLRIKMLHNGNEVYSVKKEMDIRAQSINDRTYVPARYVGYALGYDTEWKDNTVCYRDIKTQNTWFTVDKSVKFPNTFSEIFPYSLKTYQGYAGIPIADADSGSRKLVSDWAGVKTYHHGNDSYEYIKLRKIAFDTDRFNIELSNPEATVLNFKEAFDEVATPWIAWLDYGEYKGAIKAYLTISHDRDEGAGAELAGLDKKVAIGDDGYQAQWMIITYEMPVNCSHYVYQNESGEYVKGYINGRDRGSSTDGLIILHTMLEETGERIWKMMYDYYMCTGYQEATDTEYVTSDFVKSPIDENITAMYGLRYKNSTVLKKGSYYVYTRYELELADEVNGNTIKIQYSAPEVKPIWQESYPNAIAYGFTVYF